MKSKKDAPNKAIISYSNKNLNNLASIPNNVPVEKIDLSGNPITDFTGMKVFPALHILDCTNTRIISFNNFPNQEGIKAFICKKTPLCSYQLIYLMSAIVFGQSLESVNGININQATKLNALSMTAKIRPFLVKGWIIQNLDPVRIVQTQTRQRKTFYFKTDQNNGPSVDSPRDEAEQDTSNIDLDLDDQDDQDVYLEDDSEYDLELSMHSNNNNDFTDNNNNNINESNGNINENESKSEIRSESEAKTEDEIDEKLRERFMKLQETILFEMKRPDIIPTVIKGGRVTVLSSFPSRPSTSLSSRQSLDLHPRSQTTLKNYSTSSKEGNKKP